MSAIGLVGGGTMGSSIAVALTSKGLAVQLKEIDESQLERGLKNIDDLLKRLEKKGLSQEEATARRKLIQPAKTFEDLAHVSLVIEAVSEDIAVKREIFQQLDKHCAKDCILASNTSSLSITQLGSFTRRPERVIGMHFFNPAHIMKLVEVIPGIKTSDDTIESAIKFGIKLDKLAVRVEECPSFLVNRLLARYLNEALWMVQSKKASVENIDAKACELLMPIGPIALRDMNGLDIGLAVAKFNYQEYGERFKPPQILEQMVAAKMLGKKTGAGFYTYDSQSGKSTGVNPSCLALIESIGQAGPEEQDEADYLQLFLPMINEAFIVLQERICQASDLDPALKAGLGMRKGPLELAFEIGLPACLEKIEQLFTRYGERFRPAPLLKRFVWAGLTSLS